MKKSENDRKITETHERLTALARASIKQTALSNYDSTEELSSDNEEDNSKFIFKMDMDDIPKKPRKSSPIPASEAQSIVTPASQPGGLTRSSKAYESLSGLDASLQAVKSPQGFFTSALTPTPAINKDIITSLIDRFWGW